MEKTSKADMILKGSLSALSMTLVGAGATMLMAKDLYGIILMGVGFVIIYLREYTKLK